MSRKIELVEPGNNPVHMSSPNSPREMEMHEWCISNFGSVADGRWCWWPRMGYVAFAFRDHQDAIMFKLRFIENLYE